MDIHVALRLECLSKSEMPLRVKLRCEQKMLTFAYVNKVEILRNVNWHGLKHLT